ncbi:MAG: ATP-dependent helicase HrpB [Erythrobacter sp.]|uniref:ATP-dependent helicase HrpB n=1 Tax=Erythrobacter sp. TaxID=1042 RepID=UPI00260382C3|nr:ATP-dependent helicase HrpB [Erythrobacter sp.]MDJ0977152.1 ATP-dependent helicase HrpB [Erythrobacter sp.]
MSADLPIRAVLPKVSDSLREDGAAVLIAPPGAGKTTAVAPALLAEPWCTGEVILTSPRRVAARSAAERIAELLGEKAGETVGYQTRMDSKLSARTRIRIVTEAILVNRLVADPELPGVSAILFDEAHERHLESDLALALALESRAVLREDLRLLVMSATIDGARFARLLGEGAATIESAGRSYPFEIEWLGSDPSKSTEAQVVAGVMHAWRASQGDILAFLPGVREIERTRERLLERLPDALILPLHGQVEPVGQRAAIRRDPHGRRRVVLATSIAETSITLDGVSHVVDSGLARYAEFDRAAGTTQLVTRRASQAAAAQRAGRAARQGPGVVYRLWEEAGHAGRPEFAPPEIETADLTALTLRLARWGTHDPVSLSWLDPPPEASIAAARANLEAMGAIDAAGRITALGEAIVSMPMAAHEAAALLHAGQAGLAAETAELVMLLQERGLGGRSEDLLQRLSRWRSETSRRADTARRIARGWSERAQKLAVDMDSAIEHPAEALALARPDFVARRRDAKGERWLSVGGRGFTLDPASPLARAEWMVIGDAQGAARSARITGGVELSSAQIERLFKAKLGERSVANWNAEKNRVEMRRERRLGAIVLSSDPDGEPDNSVILDTLLQKARERLAELFPAGFLDRARFAGVQALLPDALSSNAELWLTPILEGRRDLNVDPKQVVEAALGLLDWNTRQAFEQSAPAFFSSPANTRHPIDYTGDDAPSAEVRVQALFGLDRHPMIGSTPLLLKLTSPAGRPIQSTRDLPGFWRGSWSDVAKDMKGRYPKHRWPDRPWLEKPSLKTKNAFNRG